MAPVKRATRIARLVDEIDTYGQEYYELMERRRKGEATTEEVFEAEQMLLGHVLEWAREKRSWY